MELVFIQKTNVDIKLMSFMISSKWVGKETMFIDDEVLKKEQS